MNRQDIKPAAVRRTASKEVRRTQLIDATIRSIAKHGIAGTTMSTVTEFAGLSIGIVNFHFKSKQNLLDETLMHLAREHHDHWRKSYEEAGQGAGAKLLAIVDAHFHPSVCTRRKLAVWYAFYGEGGRRERYRKLADDIDNARLGITTELIAQIVAEGRYRNLHPRQIAYTIESLYDGVFLNILMYPGSFRRGEAAQQIHTYLAALFPRHFDMPPLPADHTREPAI